ncbi:hypothetical protein WJX72_003378 [[Myrmecia] bisecta]|uniref:BZIP domain-containing protein n=1 Tax=[Myrmecia] bisecta TaxID=41462 RepID=A0AAW1Q377_9CHLO
MAFSQRERQVETNKSRRKNTQAADAMNTGQQGNLLTRWPSWPSSSSTGLVIADAEDPATPRCLDTSLKGRLERRRAKNRRTAAASRARARAHQQALEAQATAYQSQLAHSEQESQLVTAQLAQNPPILLGKYRYARHGQ